MKIGNDNEITKLVDVITKEYNLKYKNITNYHDNSRSSDDIRIVVILDNTYVIKLASKSLVSENELLEINNLSKRYEATNIKTPKLLKTIHNKFSYLTNYKSNPVISYVETYLDFESLESVKSPKIREQINKQVFEHLGLFTEKFKDKYLSTRNSMWSIIDHAPLDKELTEKEENINDLINTLNMLKHSDLSEQIKDETTMLLLKIKKEGKKLPQSTIQGDLNSSNIMIHNNQFEGLIDFNLYGKETNINTFLNETMYFLTDEDILNLAPKEILNKMVTTQKKRMDYILKNYQLSKEELNMIPIYRKLVYLSFYPNIRLFIHYLNIKEHRKLILDFLKLILKLQ